MGVLEYNIRATQKEYCLTRINVVSLFIALVGASFCVATNRQAAPTRVFVLWGKMPERTISAEDQIRFYEAYLKYGSTKKAARVIHAPVWKIQRSVYRMQGRCDCGRELKPNEACCEKCKQRVSKDKNKKYNYRKQNGLCVRCGEPRGDSSSTVYCEKHRQQELVAAKVRRENRRKLGLCLYCGAALDIEDPAYCSKHAPAVRKRKFQERNVTKFGGFYEAVLERDNYKCVICGGAEPRLEIHHIKKDGNNIPENLDTLCLKCHHALTDLYNSPNPQAVYEYFLAHPDY